MHSIMLGSGVVSWLRPAVKNEALFCQSKNELLELKIWYDDTYRVISLLEVQDDVSTRVALIGDVKIAHTKGFRQN